MSTPLRYVVLHHQGIAEPHYDLMFEREAGGAMMTFRCPVWPVRERVIGRLLLEHRREYLEYEGPLSGNRGHVRRVQSGTFELHSVMRAPPVIELMLLTPVRTVLRVITEYGEGESDACSIEPVV